MNRASWRAWLSIALLCGFVRTAAHADSTTTDILTGEWGGKHIRLVVKETSAAVEFDCAFGEINVPIRPDRDGSFKVRGVYMFEQGGPRRMGEPSPERNPALYSGWTDGKEMRLTVTLVNTGRDVGTFSLGLGRRAELDKCL